MPNILHSTLKVVRGPSEALSHSWKQIGFGLVLLIAKATAQSQPSTQKVIRRFTSNRLTVILFGEVDVIDELWVPLEQSPAQKEVSGRLHQKTDVKRRLSNRAALFDLPAAFSEQMRC